MNTKQRIANACPEFRQPFVCPEFYSRLLATFLVATLILVSTTGCRSRRSNSVCPPGYVPAYQPGNSWPGMYPPVAPPNTINPPVTPPNTTAPPVIPSGSTLPPVMPQTGYPPVGASGSTTATGVYPPAYPPAYPPTYPGNAAGSQAWIPPALATRPTKSRYTVAESTAYPPVVPRNDNGSTPGQSDSFRRATIPPNNAMGNQATQK